MQGVVMGCTSHESKSNSDDIEDQKGKNPI